jgi:hypothetical protein
MNTKHLPLIVAIALPIIFIITLAITLSIPASKIKPEFNFIYTDISQEYYKNYNMVQYKNMYDIKDKKLVLVPIISQKEDIYNKTQIEYKNAPTLYHYDVKTNITKEVTFEEMQKKGIKSPNNNDSLMMTYGKPDGISNNLYVGQGKFIDSNNVCKIEHINFFELGCCSIFRSHHIHTYI